MEKQFGVVYADGGAPGFRTCRSICGRNVYHGGFWMRRRGSSNSRTARGTGPSRDIGGAAWAGLGSAAARSICYTRAGLEEEAEPGIFRAASAKYRCEDMDRDEVDAELVNGPYEQIHRIANPELRVACVRAVNDWARELYKRNFGGPLHHASAATVYDVAGGNRRVVACRGVRAADRGDLRLGRRAGAGAAPDVGTGVGGRGRDRHAARVNLHANPAGGTRQIGVGVTGAEPCNQQLMRVVNFPMGMMAELMSAVVFSGICERHPGIRFVLEEAGVGWVPFMFWRFDREYHFGGSETRVFKPDVPLTMRPSEVVRKHVFFTSRSKRRVAFGGYRKSASKIFFGRVIFPGSTVHGRTRRSRVMLRSKLFWARRGSTCSCSRTPLAFTRYRLYPDHQCANARLSCLKQSSGCFQRISPVGACPAEVASPDHSGR